MSSKEVTSMLRYRWGLRSVTQSSSVVGGAVAETGSSQEAALVLVAF